jgi:hypothetical protein
MHIVAWRFRAKMAVQQPDEELQDVLHVMI